MIDTSPETMRHHGIDPIIFPDLLARLDADIAQQLKRQLVSDLVTARTALEKAMWPEPNFAAAARQAHVMIALAGTAGAVSLTARARSLLEAAQAGDAQFSADLVAGILPEIERLVGFVGSCPVPPGNRPDP